MYAEHLSSFLHASLDCYQIQHNHRFKKIEIHLQSGKFQIDKCFHFDYLLVD